MITAATTYDYPASERYNETLATLADGREMLIDTQYGVVMPLGNHAADCRVHDMGGRCSCGLLHGIDVEALVADARARGKRGPRPAAPPSREQIAADRRAVAELDADRQVCPRCGSYCCGDCDAA